MADWPSRVMRSTIPRRALEVPAVISFRGRFATFNMAIQKTFSDPIFGEGRSFVIRSERYILFNRSNYYNLISAFSRP
jgi:hypothetical protein